MNARSVFEKMRFAASASSGLRTMLRLWRETVFLSLDVRSPNRQKRLIDDRRAFSVSLILNRKRLDLALRRQDLPTFYEVFMSEHYRIEGFEKGQIDLPLVDLGAHVGLASVYFRYVLGWRGPLFLVEPSSKNFAVLKKNAAVLGPCFLIQKAVAGTERDVFFDENAVGYNHQIALESTQKPNARATTVDRLMAENGVQEIGLLKMDIEGGERDVFENRGAWLPKTRQIILELHENYPFQCFAKRVAEAGFAALSADASLGRRHPTAKKDMNFDLQPTLENEAVRIRPLKKADFEALFAVAADPLIWAQHPNPNRWQRDDFSNYFEGAVASGGAFLVFDAATDALIGSTRFYDFDEKTGGSVLIGYTFLARSHWGGRFNPALKKLMLEHAFSQGLERVEFHIGAENRRSQIAMERIGGRKIGELEVAYFGEPSKWNFVYEIRKKDWSNG